MDIKLDPRLINMNMRTEGQGRQCVPQWRDAGLSIIDPEGGFFNSAYPPADKVRDNKAIPHGSGAFIDFYGKDPRAKANDPVCWPPEKEGN